MLSSIATLLPPVGWLLISIVFYAFGEFISKTWANSPSTIEVTAVMALSALSALFWLPALFAENKLADIGVAWLVLATITTIFIGVVIFKEQLSPLQWTGAGLAIVAFLLLTATK